MLSKIGVIMALLVAVTFGQSFENQVTQPTYEEQIQKWRQDHEANLKSENGWLAITGLFWLKEGDNRFGSGGTNEVILPADSSPEQAGILRLLNGRITLIVN